jgi:hypothetical protein
MTKSPCNLIRLWSPSDKKRKKGTMILLFDPHISSPRLLTPMLIDLFSSEYNGWRVKLAIHLLLSRLRMY